MLSVVLRVVRKWYCFKITLLFTLIALRQKATTTLACIYGVSPKSLQNELTLFITRAGLHVICIPVVDSCKHAQTCIQLVKVARWENCTINIFQGDYKF